MEGGLVGMQGVHSVTFNKFQDLCSTSKNVSRDLCVTKQCLKMKTIGSFLCHVYSVTVQYTTEQLSQVEEKHSD